MQNAQVLVTHTDGKEDRLSMEFSCSGGGNLDCLRGVVSVVRQDGTALDKVGTHVEHVHEMLKNFWTSTGRLHELMDQCRLLRCQEVVETSGN